MWNVSVVNILKETLISRNAAVTNQGYDSSVMFFIFFISGEEIIYRSYEKYRGYFMAAWKYEIALEC